MRPSGSEIAPGATFPLAPPSQLDHHPIRLAFQESRSEEHTSELQSLMRISYAVFCLKKKIYKRMHEYIATTFINSTGSNLWCRLRSIFIMFGYLPLRSSTTNKD